MDLETLANMEPWEWPDDAKETLVAALRDKNLPEDDRTLAVELAGDFVVVDDEIVARLIDLVTDSTESDEIRGTAAIAFGPALEQGFTEEFIEPDDVPITEQSYDCIRSTLHEVFDAQGQPKLVRRRALEAAVRAPEEWQHDAVREAYTSDDPDWKLTAVFCMEHLRGFDKEILESLDDPDPLIQCHAVSAAGNWGVKGAWDHVATLVESDDTEEDLRITAMEAAMFIDPHGARHLMLDLLHSDEPEIQEAAQYVMSMTEAMLAEEGGEDEEEEPSR